MAKEDKKMNSSMATMALIVVALLVLVGIIAYAWNTKPDTPTSKTTTSTGTTSSAAAVDQLGSREVKITPDNFNDTIAKNKLVLIDVYSPTCPHCQKIAPILTTLSNEYGDKLVVGKMSVAVDANRNFILNYDKNFQYVPAIFIYKDGQKVESLTGERTKDEFKQLIDKYLN